jgi:hypothetical protein
MTIKDIIGTVIRTSPYSVYTVVEGIDCKLFALNLIQEIQIMIGHMT